jgi:hypothetical protein
MLWAAAAVSFIPKTKELSNEFAFIAGFSSVRRNR